MAADSSSSDQPPLRPRARRREATAVALIVLLALALRAINLGWGLPLDAHTGYYHPDERKIVQGALDFPGDIVTRSDLRYPTAYHYTLGIVSAPVRVAMARAAPTVDPFLVTAVVGRLLTLILALLTVVGTWWLGRRWYGIWGGLTAAAFVAVTLVHVVHTGYVTLDVPAAAVAVAVLWACDRIVAQPSAANVILGGVLTGLLIGTKYPGGVMVVPGLVAVAVGQRWARPEDSWWAAIISRRAALLAVLYLALTAGVTLLTTPAIALHPEHLQGAIAYESGRQGFGGTSWLGLEALLDAVDSLQVAAGWAAGVLFALALAAALYRPRYPEVLLLSGIVPYYLVLGDRVANRYLVLLVPFLALLVGRLVGLAAASPRLWLRASVVGLVAVVWLAGLGASVSAVRVIHRPDVRTQAARYLDEHAPAGATVCLDQVNETNPEAWKDPPVSADRYQLVGCLDSPQWVITIGGLGRMEKALASPYLRPDYSWDPDQLDWWPDEPATPEMLRFYDALLSGTDGRADFELAAEFAQERLPTVPFDVSGVRVWRRIP